MKRGASGIGIRPLGISILVYLSGTAALMPSLSQSTVSIYPPPSFAAPPLYSIGGNELGVTGIYCSITSGTGSVARSNIDSNNAHNCIVNLTGVGNAQVITVKISNVADSAGDFSGVISASMGVLIGDVTGAGRVTSADVSAVKQQTHQPVTKSNFRDDVNADGVIDSRDATVVRQHTGTSLP